MLKTKTEWALVIALIAAASAAPWVPYLLVR